MENEPAPEAQPKNCPLDAVVVLGSPMHQGEDGDWNFPDIIPDQHAKVGGGNIKIESVSVAMQKNLAPLFLITGGIETGFQGQNVSRALKMAQIISRLCEVPPETFEVVGKKGTTWGNVLDTVEFLETNPEVLKKRRLGILANAFHLPRAMRLFRRHPFFADIELKILPAETLLTKSDHDHLKRVISLYKSDEMNCRRKLERQGLQDLKSGTYYFRED